VTPPPPPPSQSLWRQLFSLPQPVLIVAGFGAGTVLLEVLIGVVFIGTTGRTEPRSSTRASSAVDTIVPEFTAEEIDQWRRVLRVAAEVEDSDPPDLTGYLPVKDLGNEIQLHVCGSFHQYPRVPCSILQIISDRSALVQVFGNHAGYRTCLLRGVDLSTYADGDPWRDGLYRTYAVVGRETYTTVTGAPRTVFVIRPVMDDSPRATLKQ